MPVLGVTAFPSASEVFQLVRSLLNDADIPTQSGIASTATPGANRVSTVTTITTTVAHGLQPSYIVQMQSVSDSTFNGTFTVATVPTSTTFTYIQPGAANASSGNGFVSLLIQGDVFTDAVLLNFANKAYRKVQERLLQAGSRSQITETIFFTVPAGTTSITDSTFPQLPPDFLAPRDLWDRAVGAQFFNTSSMNPVDYIPNAAPGSYNTVFAWYEDGLYFLGATQDTDIKMRYSQAKPDVSDGTGYFLIRGCEDAIASKTAEMAAASRGAMNTAFFTNMFEQDIQGLLNMQTHARQFQPSRRRANNRRRNAWTGFGWSSIESKRRG